MLLSNFLLHCELIFTSFQTIKHHCSHILGRLPHNKKAVGLLVVEEFAEVLRGKRIFHFSIKSLQCLEVWQRLIFSVLVMRIYWVE